MSSPLTPPKLKTILPSLREAISNLSSQSSSSSSVAAAFPLLLLCEITSRGVDASNFLKAFSPTTSTLSASNSSNKTIIDNKPNRNAKKNSDDDDDGIEIEQIKSLLDLIRVVAGKVPIGDDNTNGNGITTTQTFPAPMMAALNATSGMAALACLDSLSFVFTSTNNVDDDTHFNAATQSSSSSSPLLLPHLDNPTVNEAATSALRRCEEVHDGRFYTLLQLAMLSFQQQLLQSPPGGDGGDYKSASASTTTATTVTQQQHQREKRTNHLILFQSFRRIAYANYLYGASNFASSLPNASQTMVLWKKCLDVALLSCQSHPGGDDDNNDNDDNDQGYYGGSGIHSAITYSRDASITTIATPSSSPSTTTTSPTPSEEYKSYLASSYYTIIPLRHMIQIASSRNNIKRVTELRVSLSCAYLGYVHEKLKHMAGEINNTSKQAGEKKDGTNTTTSLKQLSMHELIEKYYLRRSKTLVHLHDLVSMEDLLENAEESLTLAVNNMEQDGKDTGGGDDKDDRTQQQQQQHHQQQQLQLLLHQYLRVQIHHLREETQICREVHHCHLAMLNRRPENDVSSLGGNRLGGGGGSSATATVGFSSTTMKATASETLESQVRREVYLQAWDTAWKLRTDDGITESHDILNSLSPSCLELRDALISITIFNDLNGGVTSDIVQDCYASLLSQLKRLVEIAVVVSTTYQRRREKGNTAHDEHDVSRIIWTSVLSFVSPLMADFLHALVGRGVGNDGTNVNKKDCEGTGDGKVVDNENLSPLRNNSMLRRLVEYCSETIIATAWMCEAYMFVTAACNGVNNINKMNDEELHNLDGIMPMLLSMAHDCLTSCQKLRALEDKERKLAEKEKQSVLSSKDKHTVSEQNEMLQFRNALATINCRMDLIYACSMDTGDDEKSLSSEQMLAAINTAARRATIAATTGAANKSSKTDLTSPTSLSAIASSKFGTPYIQFLSAWSGMYQSPWPFCTLTQARTIVRNARESLSVASKMWGRCPPSILERIMLDIGEADLEGILVGGFKDVAENIYRKALNTLAEEISLSVAGNEYIKEILRVHCFTGLARIYLSRDSNADLTEKLARNALTILQSESIGQNGKRRNCPAFLCIFAWTLVTLSQQSYSYHVCSARQLVAEACIQSRPEDARSFLTQAVGDFPGSSEAVLALAAFHLREMIGKTADVNEIMKAKTLLLKAAKMDTSKSDPFSLLGVWYELQNDSARARGCYQKALTMDASHPVAGRGVQRLMSLDEVLSFCRNAMKHSAPVNGWAWRILGQQQSQRDGPAALVCFQQALRCRDIQAPQNAPLGAFYSISVPLAQNTYFEACETWAELAACYRRLGKPSAALRAFEAAYSVSDGNLSPDAFCAWAQVDLDLGLYEAAAEICAMVLSMQTSFTIQRMTTYIEGEALLYLARGRIQECKFGSCLRLLTKGAARLQTLLSEVNNGGSKSNYCELKLMGDIYSCGYSLPLYAFSQSEADEQRSDGKEESFSRDVEKKLSFLIEGENAYSLALTVVREGSDEQDDAKWLVAAAAVDLGTNLLSQANVVFLASGKGSGKTDDNSSSTSVTKSNRLRRLITRSVNAYLLAIDSYPRDSAAWCGLGCALITVDPILSQHAFSRGVQLDPSLADSWSNLSLLYASHDKEKSSAVLDQITQVQDTPLAWIGRGFLLEKTGMEWTDDEVVREACLSKAADAFRSALQIQQHPAALLGLSLNCRRNPRSKAQNATYSYLADAAAMFESRMSLDIHQNMNPGIIGASYVSNLIQIEEGLTRCNNGYCPEGAAFVLEAITDLSNTIIPRDNINECFSNHGLNFELTQCEIDLSCSELLSFEEIEKFPDEKIKCVVNHSINATKFNCLGDASNAANNGIVEAQKQVLLNPESGEAWLIFASQLARGVSFGSNDTHFPSSAKVAARRAYKLLHDRVINAVMLAPRRQPIQGSKSIEYSETRAVSSLPAASLFSYSMALVSILNETDFPDNPHACDMTLAKIQESLLIDPLNSIASTLLNDHLQLVSSLVA